MLASGFAVRTVNTRISHANSFFAFCGWKFAIYHQVIHGNKNNLNVSTCEVKWSDAKADSFLLDLEEQGSSQASISRYRRSLELFRDAVAETGELQANTLEKWQRKLADEGYSARTINTSLSAVNTFFEYCGWEQLQYRHTLPVEGVQTEISRSEYRRLLQTAARLNKERAYLLVKLFANTGIQLQDLELVTGKSVHQGEILVDSCDGVQRVRILEPLRSELCRYAEELGTNGPLFVTKWGTPLNRSNVTQMITDLSDESGVPRRKANPRCLRNLYQRTRAELEANVDRLVEMGMERIMEQDQNSAV